MKITEFWRQYMQAEGLAPRTIEERIAFIDRMCKGAGAGPASITRRQLIAWMAEQDWSPKTRAHYRSTAHTFFTWLQDEEFRPDNPAARLPSVRVPRRQPTPFTIDEINALLESGIYAKTRMMVLLHYYLGLRVSEIAKVHADDINHVARTLTVTGKGGKTVEIPVPDHMWEHVERMPAEGYWFPNWHANKLYAAGEGHILGRSVSDLLSDAIKRAGIKRRPHDLRAATATEMNRAGVSAFITQHAMRHERMSTTTLYTAIDPEQIRHGLERMPLVSCPSVSHRRKVMA
jgi:integrase/recombinase XerD